MGQSIDSAEAEQALLQRDATALLDQIDLLSRLARRGAVAIVGAMPMGLLVARDIDVHVRPPTVSRAALMGVVADLVETPGVQVIRLHNMWDYGPPDFAWRPPDQPRHRGFLVEMDYLRAPGSAEAWHVDLWMLPTDVPDDAAVMATRMCAAMARDSGLRPAVLLLKRALAALTLPRRIPSVLVYRAALEDGARDMAGLLASMRQRQPDLAAILGAAWTRSAGVG